MSHDVLVITTGGTIFQRYNETSGQMELHSSIGDILKDMHYPDELKRPLTVSTINARTGAELTFETIYAVRQAVHDKPHFSGYLLVTGTDTMDEFAFVLSLLLNCQLRDRKRSFVITGAMKPSDIRGYDGPSNLQDGLRVTRLTATWLVPPVFDTCSQLCHLLAAHYCCSRSALIELLR
jgi:L-asparaginase